MAIVQAEPVREQHDHHIQVLVRRVQCREGEKFDARFDGKFYLIEDDPAHTMVAVKRINANTVEMTNQRDGKIVFVVRLEVTPDSKTIHALSQSKEDGSVKIWELRKRPI